MTRARILIADDKDSMLRLLVRLLGELHDVVTAADGTAAMLRLEEECFDVVLTDIRMPGADGFAVLRAAKGRAPTTEVIMMTAYASIPAAVEAMRLGAYDYIPKPFDPDDLVLLMARALEHKRRLQRGEAIEVDDLPVEPRSVAGATEAKRIEPPSSLPYREAVREAHDRAAHEYLVTLMRDLSGNVTRAAARAGMERESLHRLLKRYGIRSDDFKRGE